MKNLIRFLVCMVVLTATAAGQSRPPLLGKLSVAPRQATVFGQKIVYYEQGSGPVLILIHPLGWDSHVYWKVMPDLAKHFRVIAVDQLGQAASDKPLISYKMDTWTEIISELLKQWRVPKAIVAGSEMGGALAVQFGLDYPEQTAGIVVASSNSGPGAHEGGKTAAVASSARSMLAALRAQVADPALVTEEDARERWRYRLATNDGYTMSVHLADHRPRYTHEELSTIKAPVLVVWGTEDAVTPLAWGKDWVSGFDHAEFASIDGCGHIPELECPDGFARAIVKAFSGQKN